MDNYNLNYEYKEYKKEGTFDIYLESEEKEMSRKNKIKYNIYIITPPFLISFLTFYLAYKEYNETIGSDKNIFLQLFMSDNLVLDSFVILLSFGIVYTQMLLGLFFLYKLKKINKDEDILKYKELLTPAIIPIAFSTYISLIESVIYNPYIILIVTLVCCTLVLIDKILKSKKIFWIIMYKLPYKYYSIDK